MPRTQDATAPTQAAAAHRYDTVLVHVQPGVASSRRTELAAQLARRFGARLIGVGAELIEPVVSADPYSAQLVAEAYRRLGEELAVDLKSAEEAFRRDAAEAEIEWRSVEAPPARAIVTLARAADLIVMEAQDPTAKDAYRGADVAEVVMSAARPVLVAPHKAGHLKAAAVVVAWKDTREARRALADALPFLVAAKDVVIQAVGPESDVEYMQASTADVVAALRRKGVPARASVTTAPDASVVDELNAEAAAIGADLIVAGAYGHSRAREWVFGGVTRTLLGEPQHYLLLSH
jgi:nucleotide-binding universal stress UspA family protein